MCNAIKKEHKTGLLEPLSTKSCFLGEKCIIFGFSVFYHHSVPRHIHLTCGWTSDQKHWTDPKERFQDLIQISSCSPMWVASKNRDGGLYASCTSYTGEETRTTESFFFFLGVLVFTAPEFPGSWKSQL